MENFDNIPSEGVKLQVRHLIDTLHANAGSYDSDEVVAALYALRKGIREGSQVQLNKGGGKCMNDYSHVTTPYGSSL